MNKATVSILNQPQLYLMGLSLDSEGVWPYRRSVCHSCDQQSDWYLSLKCTWSSHRMQPGGCDEPRWVCPPRAAPHRRGCCCPAVTAARWAGPASAPRCGKCCCCAAAPRPPEQLGVPESAPDPPPSQAQTLSHQLQQNEICETTQSAKVCAFWFANGALSLACRESNATLQSMETVLCWTDYSKSYWKQTHGHQHTKVAE